MLQRKAYNKLKEEKNDKKIVLLLGARQVGKTTLLKELCRELSTESRCLFLDTDIVSNYEKISTFENFMNTLKTNGYAEEQKEKFYVFLDEFQKHPSLVAIMKNVYDSFNNIKIYASGSSSLAIKSQIQESLAGRKKVHEIHPLDFEEFIYFKQDNILSEQLKNAAGLKGDKLSIVLKELSSALHEFLIFGGYPEVVLKDKKQEKIDILESIFDLYVKKDLVDFLKVEKILHVKKLIEFLAVNHGQKIKYEEISQTASLKYAESKDYIEILKETYIIHPLTPFYTNKNKELAKIPKIYFIDPGVRNYFIRNFNPLSLRSDAGSLFEGFIISEFLKKGIRNIRFWQDKIGNEVDIILEKDAECIPIEVKFKKELKSEDLKSLDAFFAAYPKTKEGYLVNIGIQKPGKKVSFLLPFSLRKIK